MNRRQVAQLRRTTTTPAGRSCQPSRAGLRPVVTSASTGGLFGLYRREMGPAPTGLGPHFHRSMTESFCILDGTVRIHDGRRWVDTGPGDWIHVPIGGVHGFRNESGAPASMLIHFAPGAARDGFPDEASLAALYEAHDNHWVR